MKKILSIFTVLFTILTFGQNIDPYLQPNSSPTSGQWNKGSLQVDYDFVLPDTIKSFTNPDLRDYGKLMYDKIDNIPKFFNGEVWIGLSGKVDVVKTLSELEGYNGESDVLIWTDSLRGGFFNKVTSGLTANDGTIYNANDGGYWQRQTDSNIFIEWFGSNNSESFQKSVDFVESDTLNERYIISAKSNNIVIDATVTINVKNFNIDLYNAFIVPSETFAGTALVRVIGEYESEEKATCDFKMKFDGLDNTSDITGLEIATKQVGGTHQYYFTNLKKGLWVHGPCEKQIFNVFGGGCDELIVVEADTSIDPEEDYTPDENVFFITAGKCNTYFHDMPLSAASYLLNFNVENSEGPDYAVILEGNKIAKLRGEIRGALAGGVFINSNGLYVDFEFLHLRGVSGGYPVHVQTANVLNGTISGGGFTSGGVYIENVNGGGVLDVSLGSVSGGTGLKLGNRASSRISQNLTINYLSDMQDSSRWLEIDYLRYSTIRSSQLISGNGLLISGRNDWNSLYFSTINLINNKVFEYTGITNTGTITFFGSTAKSAITSFSYPLAGMRVERVTDERNMPAYYDSSWRYQSEKADVTSPTFITGITTPAITISGGSTSNYLRGDGSASSFAASVQSSTVGTVVPDNTAVSNGDTFKVSVNKFQGQMNAKADKVGDDDIEITDPAKGLILEDTATGTRYRIQITSGVITANALP